MGGKRYYPLTDHLTYHQSFFVPLTRMQCGHLSGKVVVPIGAHISRLIASRFQLDLLQHTMLLIARTDAESARLISSTIDARDHPYIQGVRTCLPDGSRRPSLAEVLDRAEAEGRSGTEIDNLETEWLSEVKLTTFDEGKATIFLWGGRGCSPFGRMLTVFWGGF
jgi:Isocitrate lyase family